MSASIHWRRVAKQGPRVKSVSAPSIFMEAMGRAFGQQWPMRLGRPAIPVLRGMAAVGGHDAYAFNEVAELIEEHDEIELEAVY